MSHSASQKTHSHRRGVNLSTADACLLSASCFLVLTWHDRLVAGHALGGKLVAEAVAAHERIVLASERFVGQRAVAAETAKAVLVVMSVLVEELLEEEERVKTCQSLGGHSLETQHLSLTDFKTPIITLLA